MLTVLQIMDYAAPYKGNFIPSILSLKEHLNKTDNRLVCLFPLTFPKIDWVEELESQGETIYYINRSLFSKKVRLSNIKILRDIIIKENVDIIHTHFVAYNYTLALMKVFIIPQVKIVGNFMNEFLPPLNIFNKIKVFITKITFDKIIASSAAVKQTVLNAGIDTTKIVTIYNALDVRHLQTYSTLNFKDNENQKIILMFGWTFHRKGVDIAVRAIGELIEEKNNLKLVIAMAGGQEIIKNEIINILGKMPPWIILVGPEKNIATYYYSSDIFLSSSREEGFTYSVLEASYCNSMIIVSEIGGHPLDVPYVGKFASENVDKLRVAIIEMLSKTSEEKRTINEAQRDYVVRTYDINKWSKDIINVYSDICR